MTSLRCCLSLIRSELWGLWRLGVQGLHGVDESVGLGGVLRALRPALELGLFRLRVEPTCRIWRDFGFISIRAFFWRGG